MCVNLDCHPYEAGLLGINADKFGAILSKSSLPYTDLVVREAVQNSLDAAKDIADVDYVAVNFQSGEFDRNEFSKIFKAGEADFGDIPETRNRFLAIKDQYTSGLDGDYWDKQSNFYKLIFGYNTGKDDNAQGAGGSFGLGKTVYTKVGVGIVIYYSRFQKTDSSYEERLIVFYCPTTEKSVFRDDLLPEKIGWWGRNVADPDAKRQFAPLTDPEQIKAVLDVFNIAPYENDATGTTIIIPFTDEKKQLEYVKKEESESSFPWTEDLRSYLEYSVLKWYAPRIKVLASTDNVSDQAGDTTEYEGLYPYGKKLVCTFSVGDDKAIPINTAGEPYKFFAKIRKMYSLAQDSSKSFESETQKIEWDPEAANDEIKKIKVAINDAAQKGIRWQGNHIGTLMLMRTRQADEALKSLCEQDGQALMLYCRQPGMIVRYSINDQWGKALGAACEKDRENKIIGLFVVNSQAEMTYENGMKTARIEELFRNIERPDHHIWEPETKPTIGNVQLDIEIANRVIKRIQAILKAQLPTENTKSEKAETISNFFGQFFAGNELSGNKKEKAKPFPEKEKNKKELKTNFSSPCYSFEDGQIKVKVPCSITGKPKQGKLIFELDVIAEQKKYSLKKWQESFDSEQFPIVIQGIEGISASKVKISDNQLEIDFCEEAENAKIKLENLKLVYSLLRRDVSCIIREVIKK